MKILSPLLFLPVAERLGQAGEHFLWHDLSEAVALQRAIVDLALGEAGLGLGRTLGD